MEIIKIIYNFQKIYFNLIYILFNFQKNIFFFLFIFQYILKMGTYIRFVIDSYFPIRKSYDLFPNRVGSIHISKWFRYLYFQFIL